MAEGVIHRDIKPANVLRAGNKWKISDFGFAVKSRFAFKDRVNVGTPLYMAPESLKKNCYSAKSDIYALGIVLFEMLVGRTPHEVDSEKELEERMGAEIALPRTVKSSKAVEFVSRACQTSEAKRMGREEL
jgi:serine/threonine protein kinase